MMSLENLLIMFINIRASVYNEKDKQKISKERIREQYFLLICDVLEEC